MVVSKQDNDTMNKNVFATEVGKLFESAITAFGLDPKDEQLQAAMLGDCLEILRDRIDPKFVYKAKKRLLREADAELARRLDEADGRKEKGGSSQ
jgi:hypothetical protein